MLSDMVIRSVVIKNFRCLKDIYLKLNKFNIIWGLNGTGKSSIFESIYLFKQYTRKNISSTSRGDEFRIGYGDYKDIFRNGNLEEPITIDIELQVGKSFRERINRITNKINKIFSSREMDDDLISQKYRSITYRYSFSFRNSVLFYDISYFLDDEEIMSFGTDKSEIKGNIIRFNIPKSIRNEILIHQQSTDILSPLLFSEVKDYHELINLYAELSIQLNNRFRNNVNRYYLLNPMRATIPISTQTIPIPDWIGLNGKYVLEFLSQIWGSRKYKEIKDKIAFWASEFGLQDLSAGWHGGQILQADFEDPETGYVFNLSFAGTGSRQLIPVIIQLFNSPRGSTIAIEEPEISLHLEWQIKLFEMFYDAISQNKQIIISTHSPDFIPILEGFLKKHPDMIKFTSVYSLNKKEDGSSVIKIPITKKGNLTKLPKNLKNAQDKLMKQFIDNLPVDEA